MLKFLIIMTNRVNCVETAKRIYQQLFWSVSHSVVGSWGISQTKAIEYENKETLALEVNGFIHKGWVYISYNLGADTYEVRLLNKDLEVIKFVDEAYCDNIGEIIDRLVECDNPKEYEKKIKEMYSLVNLE